MSEWELVELIGQTLEERNIAASEQTAEAVLDSIEDLIRADERKRNREADGVAAYLAVEKALIDLHAKVEALRDENNWPDAIIAYQTVLALINREASDAG
jgi:hypothetical protein